MLQYLKRLESYSDVDMVKIINRDESTSWTYADYLRDIKRCAYKLEEYAGDLGGKHIGIIAPPDYRYTVLLGAIIFSRAVAIPLNDFETDDNISFAINNAEITVFVVSENIKKSFADKTVIPEEELFSNLSSEKELSDFMDEEENNLSLIVYTSGTTSLSKGVALSAGNLFHDVRTVLPEVYIDGRENPVGAIAYTNFPLYHIGGILLWLSWSEYGCTICYSKEQKHVLADLEKNSIDFSAATPALLKIWINCIKSGRMDRLGHVRHLISGGAPIEPEVISFFMANGITVGQYYGQTEAGGVVTANFDMTGHIKSVGKPINGATLFCDNDEICICNWGNMLGYYNNPSETSKYLKDGVIYTGDLGYIDEDGYIYITGRKKNLIILSGGENISPEEIEAMIYEDSSIKECRVYEKKDRIAVDIYAPDMTENEVKEYIHNINVKMPIYKRVYYINVKNKEFEKTSSGKIKR